jgi:hypothetical protein
MATVDDRLNALEIEVAVLREQVAEQDRSNWISVVTGSFRDEPEFDEVLRLGREARQREVLDSSNGTES